MSAPVDVVVVSYERRELLLRCCDSIARLGANARAIVVDNASRDGSASAVRERFPSADVVEMESNVGFAAAVNRGLARGTAPLVLLLNSDAEIRPEPLAALVEALEADAGTAAVGPRIRDASGGLELSVGRTMTVANELGNLLAGLLHHDGRGPLTPLLERRYSSPRETASLTAACLLLRRAAIEAVDGLDERFFLYAEDVDLCLRLRDAGWRLRYVPAATVRHLRGASASVDPTASALHYRRSQLAFYAKHRGGVQVAVLRGWLLIRFGLAALLGEASRRDTARRIARLALGLDDAGSG